MRRLATLLAFLFTVPLFAGVSYHFSQETTGPQQSAISGRVDADGPHLRIEVTHGDKIIFKDNTLVLSDDGGKTLTVIDPTAKTYFILKMNDFLGGMFEQLKAAGTELTLEDPKVDIHDVGSGGTVAGFPTTKTTLDASYTLAMNILGSKMKLPIKFHSEIWRTDRVNAALTPFQMSGVRTGVDALDQMIRQYDNMGKGFPLRQVTDVVTTQPGGAAMKSTTTMNITDVQERAIAASAFAMPAGLKEVPNPIDAMLRSIKP